MRVVCFTCDEYSFIVPTFVKFFRAYWPQCPWPLEVVTDTKPIAVDVPVFTMKSGKHFSNRLLTYMTTLAWNEEYLLVMLDDYIINSPVKHDLIMRAYDLMRSNPNIAMIRLYPKPGPSLPYADDPDIGEIRRSDLYVASLQAALWRADVFRGILSPGENPWETEEAGSWRARHMPDNLRFLATKEPAIDYFNYCSKGILDPTVTAWVKEHE